MSISTEALSVSEVTMKSLTFSVCDFDDPYWKDFVLRERPNFFSTPDWSRILDSGYGVKTHVYLLKDGDAIKAGLPAALFDFKWFRLAHAYTPYGEIVGDRSLVPILLTHLKRYAGRNGIHLIRITERHPEDYGLSGISRCQSACQHLLRLDGLTQESVWQVYQRSNIERNIRRAIRSGIRLRMLTSGQEIDAYYNLYKKTMRRRGAFGPHPRSLYHEIFDRLVPQNRALFMAAEYENRFVSGILLIFDADTAFMLGNVSDPDSLNLRPNDFIIHESIMESLKRGMKFYDFMTTSEEFENPGNLSSFKSKWGAVRLPFRIYEIDVALLRTAIWSGLWRMAKTPAASGIIRALLNR